MHIQKNSRPARDLLLKKTLFIQKAFSSSLLISRIPAISITCCSFEKRLDRVSNRAGLTDYFEDPFVKASIATDSYVMESMHEKMLEIERTISEAVHQHDPVALHLLQSIPGIGKVLALVFLYEIGDINRFPSVGTFISYARLVKCAHESAGKRTAGKNTKIGNVHLKWAFGEAACLFLRDNERGKNWHQKLVSKYSKAKSLSIIAQRLGRAVYSILKKRTAFDEQRFYESLN